MPGTWFYMFPEDFRWFQFPEEKRVTCNACPKVCDADYHPQYRCCTYHPRLANFMLGFALDDPDTRPHVLSVIENGFALPEGLQHTPGQYRASLRQNVTKDFGKDSRVLCRFLEVESGRCGMYLYRNSVCSTFFCHNDHGEEGRNFWERLQYLAGQIESALAQWAMEELGLASPDYFRRFDSLAEDLDSVEADGGGWSADCRRLLWGPWFGREETFYREAAALIRREKDRLFELAGEREIGAPAIYEETFRLSLDADLRQEMDAEGPVTGRPVPVSELWYALQVGQSRIKRLNVGQAPE